jgi:hypothetical protein
VLPGELVKEADEVHGLTLSILNKSQESEGCSLVGMLLESENDPLMDERLKAYAKTHGYPPEPEEKRDDGEAHQGTRDPLD